MNTRTITTIVGFAVASLLLTSAVHARPYAPPPPEHTGFFLRLAGGLGSGSMTLDNTSEGDLSLSGLAGSTSLAIGGNVAPDFALHVDLFGAFVFNPSLAVNGMDAGEAEDTSLSLAAFGVGFTYYFMPINIYLSAAIGVGDVTLDVGGAEYESDSGVAVNVMLGKEWWVAADWGVGIAAQLQYASLPRQDMDDNFPFVSFAVLFSATYN